MGTWRALGGAIILGAFAIAAAHDRFDEVPRLETAVAPVFYPDLPNEDGAVMVTLRVSQDGKVAVARTAEGHPGYLGHARDWERTAEKWRFAARRTGGEVLVNVGFAFRRLPRGTPPEELTSVFHGQDEVEVRAVKRE